MGNGEPGGVIASRPSAIDSMPDARSRNCAGARRVALFTADHFAELLGQRNLEHQNEHRCGYSQLADEQQDAILFRQRGSLDPTFRTRKGVPEERSRL